MTTVRALADTRNVALDTAEVIDSVSSGLLIIGCTAVAFTAFLCAVDYWSSKPSYQHLGRTLAQSSVFWARWPGDRIWSAPFGELSREAARCEEILVHLQERKEADEKMSYARPPDSRIYFYGQIATRQSMLATVHSAMNYAISQGRGPQPHQPYRT
ncbi:hypothetical protein [Mycolicibacterium sp. HK-90]|uniref:hypothetical protein n=1 Tax=Mycolicibacterium sp. HK-90 TaxID=3056937 RepID=UPI002657FAD4|nr:hypothetical protein [Mycolicibacterium sp. HK-90]WKG04254.1 hypothetical protein QU592_03805 [Mycolicibacterium sp. HK-90]